VIRTPLMGAPQRFLRRLRVFPLQFWLLVAATVVFLAAMGLGFPYTSLLLCRRFGVSATVAGLILGGGAIAGLPFQFAFGRASDRHGRRFVLAVSACATMTLYVGLAFATTVWQAVLLVFVERAFGWPLFLQGSNAMIADLVGDRRRSEAYGVWRAAVMTGVVVGPAAAGVALQAGATYEQLFVAAGVSCSLFLVAVVAFVRDTRPVLEERSSSAEVASYGTVLRDRRFLLFCAASLLPLYCYGQLYSTFPIVVTSVLGISPAGWGLLLSVMAVLVAVLQYPVQRYARRYERLTLLAVASAAFGISLGGAVFAGAGWALVGLIPLLALGDILESPVSSTVVAGMASPAVRGRYIGVWTMVWTFGMALGPTFGGLFLDVLGPQGSSALVVVAGMAGAVAMLRLQPRTVPLVAALRRAKR
jgi:MFS family permease